MVGEGCNDFEGGGWRDTFNADQTKANNIQDYWDRTRPSEFVIVQQLEERMRVCVSNVIWDEANASSMPVHTKLDRWVRKLNKEVHCTLTYWCGYASGRHIRTGRRCRRCPGRSKAMVRSRDPSGHRRSSKRRKIFSTILVISSRKWADCQA